MAGFSSVRALPGRQTGIVGVNLFLVNAIGFRHDGSEQFPRSIRAIRVMPKFLESIMKHAGKKRVL